MASSYKKREYYLEIGRIIVDLLDILNYKSRMDLGYKIYNYLGAEKKYRSINRLFDDDDGQFNFCSDYAKKDRPLEDIIANIIFLANELAHTLSENEFVEQNDIIVDARSTLFDIKDNCLEDLIDLKNNGEKILIGYMFDNKKISKSHTYFLALPGYFRVFSLHTGKKYKVDIDKDESFKKFYDNRSTYIPIRIDPDDCEEIKNKSQKPTFGRSFPEDYQTIIRRFLDVQEYFKNYEKNQQDDLEKSKEEIEIGKRVGKFTGRLQNREETITSYNKKKDKLKSKELDTTDWDKKIKDLEGEIKDAVDLMKNIFSIDGRRMSKEEMVTYIILLRTTLKEKKERDKFLTKQIEAYEQDLENCGIDEDQALDYMVEKEDIEKVIADLEGKNEEIERFI